MSRACPTSDSTPVLTPTENRLLDQQLYVVMETNLREQKQKLDALLAVANAGDTLADPDKILYATVEGLIALVSASSLLPEFQTALILNPNLVPNANGSPMPEAVTTATKESKLVTPSILLAELSSCYLPMEGTPDFKPAQQPSGESPVQNEGMKGEEIEIQVNKCGESEIDSGVSSDCEQYNGHTDCPCHSYNRHNKGSKNKEEISVSKKELVIPKPGTQNQMTSFKAFILLEITHAMLQMWNNLIYEALQNYTNASDEEDELRKLVDRDAQFSEEFDEYFKSVSAPHKTESVPPALISTEKGVLKNPTVVVVVVPESLQVEPI